MKIKILTACTGVDFDGREFSFSQGDEHTVKKDLGDDLIQAGHAEEVAAPAKKEDKVAEPKKETKKKGDK